LHAGLRWVNAARSIIERSHAGYVEGANFVIMLRVDTARESSLIMSQHPLALGSKMNVVIPAAVLVISLICVLLMDAIETAVLLTFPS
jgi:hypothetical protein